MVELLRRNSSTRCQYWTWRPSLVHYLWSWTV